jgi:xanthine dehydrogenase accessory factor
MLRWRGAPAFRVVDAADAPALRQRLAPRQPVALFGGGHVGQALVRVLAPLPFALHWMDSRDEVFPPRWRGHAVRAFRPGAGRRAELAPQSRCSS